MSYLYISHCPTWGGNEKPFVVLQVGFGWWHRFMSPTFSSLDEAVSFARDYCRKATLASFTLLKREELPKDFAPFANNPQTWRGAE